MVKIFQRFNHKIDETLNKIHLSSSVLMHSINCAVCVFFLSCVICICLESVQIDVLTTYEHTEKMLNFSNVFYSRKYGPMAK